MTESEKTARKLEEMLRAAQVEQYALTVSDSEKRELNTEHVHFNLYRTTFEKSASVTVYLDGRKGAASGNDLTEEGLQGLVRDAREGALSAAPDEANGVAERQPASVFHTGPWEPDMERFYDRLKEAVDSISRDYPLIRLNVLIGSHTRSHEVYLNSSGTCFERYDACYETTLEFAGNDGEKTTGLNYAAVATNSLDEPLLEKGDLKTLLRDTEKSLRVVPVGDKFEGAVIFTPAALNGFSWMLLDNFAGPSVVMTETSRWLNHLGEQVASPLVTLSLKAKDGRLARTAPVTADGYLAQDVTVLDQGVLKTFLLNLYTARKTGRPVTLNDGGLLVMEPGETPLREMIRGISRGLIVGGFSGGEPGVNGEFSGVAKNSFLVENGEITGAVMETMISGNLADVFSNVKAVSREQVSDGVSAFPYLMTEGITISGS